MEKSPSIIINFRGSAIESSKFSHLHHIIQSRGDPTDPSDQFVERPLLHMIIIIIDGRARSLAAEWITKL